MSFANPDYTSLLLFVQIFSSYLCSLSIVDERQGRACIIRDRILDFAKGNTSKGAGLLNVNQSSVFELKQSGQNERYRIGDMHFIEIPYADRLSSSFSRFSDQFIFFEVIA
jgi:hypothetical protein